MARLGRQIVHSSLAPQKEWYSWLNDTLPTRAEYAVLKKIWRDEGMNTMADCLRWYNDRDVKPLVEALEKLTAMWREKDDISLFTEHISFSGVTLTSLFYSLRDRTPRPGETDAEFVDHTSAVFSRVSPRDGSWYSCMRTNILGGPSIVFKRLVDATGNPLLADGHPERYLGTRIQGGAKRMKNVVGYDAVSLYWVARCNTVATLARSYWGHSAFSWTDGMVSRRGHTSFTAVTGTALRCVVSILPRFTDPASRLSMKCMPTWCDVRVFGEICSTVVWWKLGNATGIGRNATIPRFADSSPTVSACCPSKPLTRPENPVFGFVECNNALEPTPN